MESVLKKAEGVAEADASFIRGEVSVKYNPDKIAPQGLVDLINRRTFYKASLPERQVVGEAGKVSRALIEIQGANYPIEANIILSEIGIAMKGVKGIYDFKLTEDGKGLVDYGAESIGIADIRKIASDTLGSSMLKGALSISVTKAGEKE